MNPISSIFWEIPEKHLKLENRVCESYLADVYKGSWDGTTVAVKKFVTDFLKSFKLDPILKELDPYYINHPNILTFYGYSFGVTFDGFNIYKNLSLIQEWCPLTLQDIIKAERLADANIRKIESGLIVAINFLHFKGIAHKNLKSSNVFLTEQYHAKIGHFSTPTLHKQCSTICASTKRQPSNRFCYRPSETMSRDWDAENIKMNTRADIYSIGMLLWVIRAWKEPFAERTNDREEVMKIRSGIQETIPSDCSRRRASLIQDCWKEASKRLTAPQVKERLETIHQEESAEETSVHKLP